VLLATELSQLEAFDADTQLRNGRMERGTPL